MTYQDYCILLSNGVVQQPSDELLDSIEDVGHNYYLRLGRVWYMPFRHKYFSFKGIINNITVGQFIRLSRCKTIEDFLQELNVPITISQLADNDYRTVLLFNRQITKTLDGIAKAMDAAYLEPLPDESGLESVRDDSLKMLHLLNFTRTSFGYKSFDDAEKHNMAEVLVLMRLNADDERYRRAYQSKIDRKHKLR